MHCTCPNAARRALVLLRAALLLALPCALSAQSIEWNGPSGGSWITDGNWSLGSVPDSSSDVLLVSATGGASMITSLLNGDIVVRSVTFNNHLGTLLGNSTAGYRVIGGPSSGSLRFDTAGIAILDLSNTVNQTQNISFNANASQSVTLNLNYSGAGTIDIGAGSVLAISANGTRITGTGGLIKTGAGTLRIGGNQNANLPSLGTYEGGFELLQGAVQIAFNGNATSNAFGTGNLTLSGGQLSSSSATAKTVFNNVTLNGSIELGDATTTGNLTFNSSSGTRTTTLAANSSLHIGQNAVTWEQDIGESGGARSLTKTGAGRLTLSGVNTFTGLMTVDAGELRLTGSLAGGLTVAADGSFSGSGTVNGNASIAGTHNPGNSPGIQNFSNDLTYIAVATVNWELNANTTTQGDPTAVFDQINVGGTLDFAGATLLNLSFSGAGSTVNWNDALWSSDQEWKIYDSAAVANFSNLSLVTSNWVDSDGNFFDTLLAGASFSLSLDGADVYLSYTAAAIPEPSTYAALLGALALGLVAWRRRRTRLA